MDTELFSEGLTVVDRNDEVKKKVYSFSVQESIVDIISYFLGLNTNNEPFYIVDLYGVQSQYERWIRNLPRVHPYYAIKSNPDPMILYVLAKLGCGFDCASREEIIMAKLNDIPNDKIIYANPCKKPDSLVYAKNADVDYLTFDCSNELDKIKLLHPDALCIIRIQVDDSGSVCKFNSKFGCVTQSAEKLLEQAKINDIRVVGISWHVGSNCKVPGKFKSAFSTAREIYNYGKKLGFNLNIIDIGGGFPGIDGEIKFESIAAEINSAIEEFFFDVDDAMFIGEPGRFLCTSSHTLVNTVIGIKSKDDMYQYTIDDTIYGSYNCIMFDHTTPEIYSYRLNDNKPLYRSNIVGQSCDSLDMGLNGNEPILLPKLAIGDKIYVKNFGAYTCASSSSFNGFTPPGKYYIIRTNQSL